MSEESGADYSIKEDKNICNNLWKSLNFRSMRGTNSMQLAITGFNVWTPDCLSVFQVECAY